MRMLSIKNVMYFGGVVKTNYDKWGLIVNVVSMLFIGAASVFISVASMQVAKIQNDITATEYLPFFYVSYEYVMKGEKLNQKSLSVYNIGAPIANAKVDIDEFIVVNNTVDGEHSENIIPVSGFYFVNNPTGQPTGKIHTAWAQENVEDEAKLHEITYEPGFSEEFGSTELEIVAAVKVYYLSRLGTAGNKFFLNDRQVDEEEYKNFISRAYKRFPFNISEFKLKELMHVLGKKGT